MKKFLSPFLLLAWLLINAGSAYSNGLIITPNRLQFKDDTSHQEVKLINNSDEEITYRISLEHLRMDEDGSYKVINDNDSKAKEKFADQLLLFSPQRVTLKPHQVQTVRIMVQKPESLAFGEYRSHMLFKEEPPIYPKQNNNIEKNKNNQSKGKISIILKPLFGISIPVIVEHGKLNAMSDIKNVAINDSKNGKYISFDLNRDGDASLYGSIIISLQSGKNTKEYKIGTLNNIAIFYPYLKRHIRINLDKLPANVGWNDSIIKVKYLTKSLDPQEDEKIISESYLHISKN
jgi:fimbrial chaperone protein